MIRIACDVDDVLGAMYPHLCQKFDRPEKMIDIWDGEVANKWVGDLFPELYKDLELYSSIPRLSSPGAINFEIDHYITSIPTFLHNVREKWLEDNGFPDSPLVCTLGNKVDTMQALGLNVLIDDKPSTIKAVREAGMIGIQFVPPYMSVYDKNDPFTVKHLSQVGDILKNL